MRSLTAFAVVTLLAGFGWKTTNTNKSQVASNGGGGYSVSYYTPGSMPVECHTPPGFSFNDGVAVVEGDPPNRRSDLQWLVKWTAGLHQSTARKEALRHHLQDQLQR